MGMLVESMKNLNVSLLFHPLRAHTNLCIRQRRAKKKIALILNHLYQKLLLGHQIYKFYAPISQMKEMAYHVES